MVLENQAYRFMVMQGAVQSVMDIIDPQAIVFAHQQVMLRNLHSMPAGSRVLELGLGGGSAVRHAKWHNLPLHWTTVEQSAEVINVFWDYFDTPEPSALTHWVELADSREYLTRASHQTQFELILCDVYDELSSDLIRLCVKHLRANGELVVNWLPHMQTQGAQSTAFFSALTQELNLTHEVEGVVGFANQIHRLRHIQGGQQPPTSNKDSYD